MDHRESKDTSSGFFIGNVKIPGDLILAPMDGYSNHPFRRITRSLGSAASYSEFINARDIINGHPFLSQRIYFSDDERPFIYQLVDNDVERLVIAAIKLRSRNPDAIDINLGCSTPSVSGRGAGAGLLRDPGKVKAILSALCGNLDIPVTAKIRLGWDESSKNYLQIAEIVESSGCKAVAVHARTKRQGFSGNADWNAIKEIKERLSIPVIGNGDVHNVRDINNLIEQTHCDAIMIGRAAIQNPWIFSRLDRESISRIDVFQVIVEQLGYMQEFFGEEVGMVLFRKYLVRYLSLLHVRKDIRVSLLQEMNKSVLLEKISSFLCL